MMIFRAFETLGERNVSEGFHVLFVYVNDVTGGLFINMLLFGFFLILFLGSYFSQSRTGSPNLAGSFAIAGYVTAGLSLTLSLVPGLINPLTVVISIAVSIAGTLWLFTSGSGR